MIGRIKFFKEDKGFGFITKKENGDIFFHISSCEYEPKSGDEVIFDIRDGRKGKEAYKIYPLNEIDFRIGGMYDEYYYHAYYNEKCISSESIDAIEKEMEKVSSKSVEFVEFEKDYMICNLYVNDEFVRKFETNIRDEEFVSKYFPEKIEEVEVYREKREVERKKEKLERNKREVEWINMVIHTVWENLQIEFPSLVEFEVENIYHRDEIHWDVWEAMAEYGIINKDIYMDVAEIDNMAEDEFYVEGTNSTWKSNKYLRNKFNKVFEPYTTECVVRDNKDNEKTFYRINKRFAEHFHVALINILDMKEKEQVKKEIEEMKEFLREENII